MMGYKVKDAMTRDVFALTPDTSVTTAAQLFVNRHITGAPVMDSVGRVVGVVSLVDLADPDRDRTDRMGTSAFYHRSAGRLNLAFGEVPVSAEGVVADVMSPFILSVKAEAPLIDAVRLMLADDVHRLLVLDQEGRLAGLVSTMDIMRTLVQSLAEGKLPQERRTAT
jgi:CBS-domain-containing membrane protein